MVKKILLYINILWVGSCSYTLLPPKISQQPEKILSLQAISTKSLFFFKTHDEKKELNRKLKTDPVFRERLKFDGLLIEGLDLSEMYLKDIDFRGCVFRDVKFNRSDLRGCEFDECEFKECQFENAILYSSSDVAEEKVSIEGFKIEDWSPLVLIKLYSSLVKESKLKQECNVPNEALAKSRCLNKFFPGLRLCLSLKDLTDLDLTDINLENANLTYADLRGTRLSGNVKVPDYPIDNRSELFSKWVEGSLEEQEAYQKLANARFNLVHGVEHTRLVKGIEDKKKDLKNAYLADADLQGADLSEANLQNANLRNAHLEGADLSEANLQNVCLMYADLRGTRLSGNVKVPNYSENNKSELFSKWVEGNLEEQEAYQKLANARFNLVSGVEHARLVKWIVTKKKNLKNAYLYNVDLRGADLSQANLQKAYLLYAHLEGADLSQANLQKADLVNAHLEGADLSEANLQNVALMNTHLEGANLRETIISRAVLSPFFILPLDCEDEYLMGIYQSCNDQKAKILLKIILKAKDLWVEQTQ